MTPHIMIFLLLSPGMHCTMYYTIVGIYLDATNLDTVYQLN